MTHINYIRAEAQDDIDSFMSLNTVQNEFLSQKALTRIEELNLNNFIGVVITHTFDDTQLPMEFDCMFLDNFEGAPVITKATLRGCFNYRTKFHTMLWKGHSHFAIFEFDHEVPEILHALKYHGQKKRWDPNLIICSRADADVCRDYLKKEKQDFERYMKEKNPQIYEANKREEEEFKRNLK